MGAYCFEKAEEKGIKTHYRGVVGREGKVVRVDELHEPTSIMEINLVRVIRPKGSGIHYDYGAFTHDLVNFLVPMEIMYRNSLPEGSSIFRRLKNGQISYGDLGLDHYPKPGEKLEKPFFDVSTKLEEQDRYITWSEAQKIASLTDEEVEEIKEKLSHSNNLISKIAARANLQNDDGKIELAFDGNRKLIVADVIGTLDECRFTYEGLHVSKEIARQYYKKTEWYRDVEKAKRESDIEGIKDWKSLCSSQPSKLDPLLKKIIYDMYLAATNECTGLNLFDVSSLANTVKEYRKYLSEKNAS
jgi:phosphoribosylaminoimidazole-succinocarboxamide synthase